MRRPRVLKGAPLRPLAALASAPKIGPLLKRLATLRRVLNVEIMLRTLLNVILTLRTLLDMVV